MWLDRTVTLFPYIWNEATVQVGYGADLDFVATTMRDATMEVIGTEMFERVEKYKHLLARTPVDEVQVKEQPVVLFRTNAQAWIDATVRYLVMPRQAGSTRSRVLLRMIERLKAAPDKVQFPRGDSR